MTLTVSSKTENDPSLVNTVQEMLQFVASVKHKTFVVKLGGSTLEHQKTVLQDLIWLHELGVKVVLVHGGGPVISAWLKKLQLPVNFEQGLRVTNAQTLEVVRMVLCGQINQDLLTLAAQLGGNAVGLCGMDGNMIQAHILSDRLGFVGEIDTVDTTLVSQMITTGYLPIIAPIACGPKGICLNINADLVASHLAGALNADRLIFLSDVNGIRGAQGEHLAELTEAGARGLIEDGTINGGMIPKVRACLDALTEVPRIHIVSGSAPHVLLSELEDHPHIGTTITR